MFRKATQGVVASLLNKHQPCCLSQKRFRYKKKWATTRKKKTPSHLALEHFDQFYSPIYEQLWPSIRIALLSQQKYCALVNNYSSTTDETVMNLICNGADDFVKIAAENQMQDRYNSADQLVNDQTQNNIYSDSSSENQTSNSNYDNSDKDKDEVSRADLYSFISPKAVYTEEQLLSQEEMSQFQLSNHGSVEVNTLRGSPVYFPHHLRVHTYSPGDVTMFSPPRADEAGRLISSTGSMGDPRANSRYSDYYLLDAASIVPVLALNLQPGDKVLDLCAAPGGKTLTMLQTMLPGEITCMDRSYSRLNRLRDIMRRYLPGDYGDHVNVLHTDVLNLKAMDTHSLYDKVLVDVPCTTDRHVLHEDDNSIFKAGRLRERLDLPKLQKDLLCTGIQNCRIGGSIVYSTCSLSPGQNDGVIQAAVEHLWHHTNISVVVEKIDEIAVRLENVMKFYSKCRFGQLILPSLKANFGPMYICKLKRIE